MRVRFSLPGSVTRNAPFPAAPNIPLWSRASCRKPRFRSRCGLSICPVRCRRGVPAVAASTSAPQVFPAAVPVLLKATPGPAADPCTGVSHVDRASLGAGRNEANISASGNRVQHRHVVNADDAERMPDTASLQKDGDRITDGLRHAVTGRQPPRSSRQSHRTTGKKQNIKSRSLPRPADQAGQVESLSPVPGP